MSTFPSNFDLEVWSGYQMGELRRIRQQADLLQPPSRIRITLAHMLIALANRLWRPEPIAEAPAPLPQPS